MKVLLVEDLPLAAKIARFILAELHCEVDVAINAAEALIKAQSQSYDLIFMDVGLPGINGIEATALIRKREADSGLKRVPIIAITGHGDRETCIRSGMDDYLQKPALISDFQKMLNKWLESDPARN